MKKSILLFTIIIFFASCKKQSYKTEIGLNLYSLEIPIDMESTPHLNPQASFQYQSSAKDLYTIVIVEDKKMVHDNSNIKNLSLYTETTKNMIAKNMDTTPTFGNIQTSTIDNVKKTTFDLTGKFSGLDIYYLCSNIESEHYYYQILTWTGLNKKEENAESMLRIIESFKELDNHSRHDSHVH